MARLNTKPENMKRTHEGAPAFPHLKPIQQLRRSVLSCLLWENEFYEDGESIAARISKVAEQCKPGDVASLAIEAREQFNLRHAPLLLLEVLTRTGSGTRLVGDTVERVIQRADEPGEFLAIMKAKGMGRTVPNQVKIGLARAFKKFDEYQLAKYDRAAQYRLRDVMFLTHPKPNGNGETERLKRLAEQELQTPDTWEVALSGGADKRETFERLLQEQKLGYLALLRNLRNMQEAGVDEGLIRNAILARKGAHRVLPFRFIAAAKAAPKFEDAIDGAMLATLQQAPRIKGKTVVIIDVSGSMYHSRVSARSDMDRALAACALGAIMRETCEHPVIYATAGNDGTRIHKTKLVPSRRGMALVDSIYSMCRPLGGGGIFLNQVSKFIREQEGNAARTVVITDEQDCADSDDSPLKAMPLGRGYLINVASSRNGIGYGRWTHIDGFSEAVIRFISESEKAS